MKLWIKILVGLGILWIPISNFILVYLALSDLSKHLPMLVLSSLLSSIILGANWVFLSIYTYRRTELPIQKRVLWIIGFVAGPVGLVVQPCFYFTYILKHPAHLRTFDPLGSDIHPSTP